MDTLMDEVEEWVAEWQNKSHHVIMFEDMQAAFPNVPIKTLKKMFREFCD